jgi:hypothetical protein
VSCCIVRRHKLCLALLTRHYAQEERAAKQIKQSWEFDCSCSLHNSVRLNANQIALQTTERNGGNFRNVETVCCGTCKAFTEYLWRLSRFPLFGDSCVAWLASPYTCWGLWIHQSYAGLFLYSRMLTWNAIVPCLYSEGHKEQREGVWRDRKHFTCLLLLHILDVYFTSITRWFRRVFYQFFPVACLYCLNRFHAAKARFQWRVLVNTKITLQVP